MGANAPGNIFCIVMFSLNSSLDNQLCETQMYAKLWFKAVAKALPKPKLIVKAHSKSCIQIIKSACFYDATFVIDVKALPPDPSGLANI